MRFTSLKCKEFIDVNKGKRLGYIRDLDIEFNICTGVIHTLIIPKHTLFGLKKEDSGLHLHWYQIKVIGQDVILIDLSSPT